MIALPFVLALMYILTSFIVKKNPRLIAGYEQLLNSANGEWKLKKAGNILFYNLIICAVPTIILGYLGYFLDWKILFISALILPLVIALIISVNRINKL